MNAIPSRGLHGVLAALAAVGFVVLALVGPIHDAGAENKPNAPAPFQHQEPPRLQPGAARGLKSPPVVVSCRPNLADGGVSVDNPGWSLQTSWATFMRATVTDPGTKTAGAVLSCEYGYPSNDGQYPSDIKVLSINAGAGIKASMCSVSGNTVRCTGRPAPIVCPTPRAESAPSLNVQGWTLLTGYVNALLRVEVTDPPSMNAGTSIACHYGVQSPGQRPVPLFTSSINAGAGISAAMCKVADKTITCQRP